MEKKNANNGILDYLNLFLLRPVDVSGGDIPVCGIIPPRLPELVS